MRMLKPTECFPVLHLTFDFKTRQKGKLQTVKLFFSQKPLIVGSSIK